MIIVATDETGRRLGVEVDNERPDYGWVMEADNKDRSSWHRFRLASPLELATALEIKSELTPVSHLPEPGEFA